MSPYIFVCQLLFINYNNYLNYAFPTLITITNIITLCISYSITITINNLGKCPNSITLLIFYYFCQSQFNDVSNEIIELQIKNTHLSTQNYLKKIHERYIRLDSLCYKPRYIVEYCRSTLQVSYHLCRYLFLCRFHGGRC